MKPKFNFKFTLINRVSLVVLLLVQHSYINAQITLNTTMTPAQYVTGVLQGTGVTITNITYNGSAAAANTVQSNMASFTNTNPAFPMASGVVLTTGAATIATGPNNTTAAGTGSGANIVDTDLDALTGSTQQNGGVIEFDFSTTSNTMSFSYLFGSEEYRTFVGTSFNDVFGFFLSGPGFSGPFSNGAVNLAVVPNTATPITINTINNGTGNTGPCTNCAYYVDNANGIAYGTTIQYNSTTTLLTATANVQCNQVYHIKMAICNVSDKSYDSGVFLLSQSFTAVPDAIFAGNNQTVCGQAGTVVSLNGNNGNLSNLNWSTSGTGTFASPTNQTNTYTLSAADVANSSVTLTYTGTNPCTGNIVSSSVVINFANPTVTVTPATATICIGQGTQSVNLIGTTTANPAVRIPVAFTSTPGTSIPNNATGITSNQSVAGISANNLATNQLVSVRVNITHPKSAELSLSLVSPSGQTIALKTGTSGLGNTTGANCTNTEFSMSGLTSINLGIPSYTGTFIPVGNLNSYTGAVNGTWSLRVIDNASGIFDNTTNGTLVNWTLNFTTDNSIASFSWSPITNMTNSTSLTPTVSPTSTTTYTLTATDAAGCVRSNSMTVTVNNPVTATFNPIPSFCSGTTAPTLPTTSTNGFTGTWSPSTVSNTASGTYTFTPTAGQCALGTTMNITVVPLTVPSFTPLGPFCQNATPGSLLTTSNNGITGTWSPSTVSTSTSGSTTYTFTPTSTTTPVCATSTTMTIVVNPPTTPTFTLLGPYCQNETPGILPTTSNNGITGTWSPSTVNTASVGSTTYTFTPSSSVSPVCAIPTTMTIVVNAPTLPLFTQLGPYCQNTTPGTLPATSNNGITGTWSPATISTASIGSTTYTFTPSSSTSPTCALPTTMVVLITAPVTPSFTPLANVCQNGTAPALPTTSNNGITGTWSPSSFSTTTAGTFTSTFTPTTGQCATTTTITLTVDPTIVPLFTQIAPFCSGSTAPTLPTTSTNGVTGTWSPSTVSNTASGTYTFTPSSGGGCTTTATMTITVDPLLTPTFNSVGPFCSGSTIAALPTTSTNGITGTWSPAINNTATTTYTFTPTSGLCATTTTLTITITPPVTPTFNPSGPFCSGATIPALPTTSNNGITGTWSPAINNTATTTYTFTPGVGQCGLTTTLTITIIPLVTPTFTPLANVCQNATAPSLPTTSNNGITGTWSPSSFSTATAGTFTSTFTPTTGQCATTTTITLTVDATVPPTFNPVPPLCVNDTPPVLPTTSTNGISGTWSPSTINTSTAGSTSYTFTPSGAQCSQPLTITVTVGPPATPTFTQVAAFCENTTAPVLPTSSLEGFTGTWSPSTVSNTVSGTYTFTPSGTQCATNATMTITVTPRVNPTFNPSGPFCSGATIPALPTTSTNGITGTWSPAINNTATTTYTFTPAASECANPTTLTIAITAPVTPSFTALANVCQNGTAPSLPTTSNNGITGTWSPSSFSTAVAGTFTSTFTPTAGQCATTTTISFTVNALPVVTVNSASTCANVPVTLTAAGALNYNWTPAIGLSSTTANPVTSTVATTTTYTVIGTAANGCIGNAQATVSITPPLTVTATAPTTTICEGESVTLSATGATTYAWTPSGSLSGATGANVAATPSSTQTYTVTGSNPNGCTGTANITIVVNAPIVAQFASQPDYCAGSVVTALPATSSNGINGTWSPAIDNQNTTTYTFTPSSGQCALGNAATIVINQPTPVVFAALDTICEDGIAPQLPATDLNGITGSWSPSTVSNTATGTYTFTPNTAECALQGTVTAVVVQNPDASFGMSSDVLDVSSTTVNFFNTSTNATSYEWSFGDGGTSTEESPSNTYPEDLASYTVTLFAVNDFGCTDLATHAITVKQDLLIYVPNSFTPDGDEHNNTFYPVISGDFDAENYTMVLFNRWGEVVFETHDVNFGWDGTYHDQMVQEGTYTWKINIKLKSNDGKRVFTGHVVILR